MYLSGKRKIEGAQHVAGRPLDILICKAPEAVFPIFYRHEESYYFLTHHSISVANFYIFVNLQHAILLKVQVQIALTLASWK